MQLAGETIGNDSAHVQSTKVTTQQLTRRYRQASLGRLQRRHRSTQAHDVAVARQRGDDPAHERGEPSSTVRR